MRTTIGALLTVLVFGVLWRARAWFGSVEFAEDQGVAYYEQIYYPTLPRLDGLLAGVTLALVQVFRPAWWARLMARPLISFIAGLVCFAASVFVFDADPSAGSVMFGFPLVALTMACFVAACVSPKSFVQRVKMPGVATIAALSYSLYLSHKFALHVAAMNGFDGFIGLSVATLAFGAALHFGVEWPFLKLRERLRPSPLAARDPLPAGEGSVQPA